MSRTIHRIGAWLSRWRRGLVLTLAVPLAAVSAVVVLSPAAVAASARPPVPGPQLQFVSNYSAPIPYWVDWHAGSDRHEYGTFRISSHANRDVIYQSAGLYFNYSACTYIRMRYMEGDSQTNTWYYSPTMRRCGGEQVMLDGNAPVNTRFYWQCWAVDPAMRASTNPCAGSLTF